MPSPIINTLRRSRRREGEPLNILTFPTHERYETNLAKTGHNFYAWQVPGTTKPWVEDYAPIPDNYQILNPNRQARQLPMHIDIDLVLSQHKFGQFQTAVQLAPQIGCPMVSLEHTLPRQEWGQEQLVPLARMKGDVNVFISEYSRDRWGWGPDEAEVIHHGIDTEQFCPSPSLPPSERDKFALSVVNDWVNRDWCCGFKLWQHITKYPNADIPIKVFGSTPGLSNPSPDLPADYRMTRVFLNTSTISPVPTALLEAMSSGCAVVTTATCMIPEIIEHNVNGLISNDPDELRKYTKQLLEDDELANRLGAAARKTIEEHFGLDSFISGWNEIFNHALYLQESTFLDD